MKQCILILITLFFSCNLLSQNNFDENKPSIEKQNELRLGVIKLLSGAIFEGSYEFIKDSNQGLGAHLLLNFDQGNDYLENYSLTPYYRMYFQTKEDYGARGFFVEGFSAFFLTDYDLDADFSSVESEDVFDISIGIALGIKWINTAGFVFEIKAGSGRNLLGNASFDALFKGDFSIGYRF